MKRKALNQSSAKNNQRRKILFYVIMFLIPALFFVLLELSLRIFNYGPNLSLFRCSIINGKTYYTLNPSVKSRYFNLTNFNPDPSPENFHVPKTKGTFRIFCLGGSTTVGFPYWYNGSFPSFLRDRLKAVFPNRSIEIINLGMTATNSYTVLDLAKELINYQPDLFIVYDGHNEFYGALGAASNETGVSERWMAILHLQLIHLRTYQLVNNIISGISSLFGKTSFDYLKRGTMMEQVAKGENVSYNSSLYKKAYGIFRKNLEVLKELARDNHIPLILGTQMSNLRDQSPFISNNSPGLSEQEKSLFQQLYKKGINFQVNRNLDSAIACFNSAISIDPLFADAHYRLAQSLYIKGEKREAYNEYILARDYDELRFRTDSNFNKLILSMDDGKNCFVADIEEAFKSLSEDSLPGHDLIFEHLHPNSKGNFIIAKEYARLMRNHDILASMDRWIKQDTVSDSSLWVDRHLTDIDESMAKQKIEILTSGWPFRKETQPPPPVAETDTLGMIANMAIHNQFGWVTAHNDAADFYLRRKDFLSAAREYETIADQIWFDPEAFNKLAQIYFIQNKFDNADSILHTSLNVSKTPLAYRLLGDINLKQRKPEAAIPYYEELIKFPEDPSTAPENNYMLAFAYLKTGKNDLAVSLLKQTINRYPDYKPARELLEKLGKVR